MAADHRRPGTDDELAVAAGHELSDAQAAPALKFLVVLFVTTIIIAGLMVFFYNYLEHREAVEKAPRFPIAAEQPRALPPPPRLQHYPYQDVKVFRQEEERFLHGHSWVDQGAGTVRIPIDRAIEMLAAQGLPHRAAPARDPGATAPGAGLTMPTGAASGREPIAAPAGDDTQAPGQPGSPGEQPDGGQRPPGGEQGQPR